MKNKSSGTGRPLIVYTAERMIIHLRKCLFLLHLPAIKLPRIIRKTEKNALTLHAEAKINLVNYVGLLPEDRLQKSASQFHSMEYSKNDHVFITHSFFVKSLKTAFYPSFCYSIMRNGW